MKAVVLEIKDGKAAVLKKNGEIIMIKQNELQVGDTIEIFGSTRGEGIGPIAAEGMKRLVAAAFVAAIAAGGCWTTYNTAFAASYVSLDVNPSIEFVLNRWNRIIGVTSINDDAISIVKELETKSIKGKSISQAIDTTTAVLKENNYLKDAENFILVNVSSNEEDRTETLTAIIDDTLSQLDGSTQVSTNDSISVKDKTAQSSITDTSIVTDTDSSGSSLKYLINTGDLTDHQMALNLGISTGRYQEMRTVEARNSLNRVAADDTDTVNERATEIQVDRSMAQRYQDASVEDLLKGSGAITGYYKAPELKRDDGDVSIRDLNINYETHAESTQADIDMAPGAMGDFTPGDDIGESVPETSPGLDPLEEAAILNDELTHGNPEHSAEVDSRGDTGTADGSQEISGGPTTRGQTTGPSAGNDASINAPQGPISIETPGDTSQSGPMPGAGSDGGTYGPQTPGSIGSSNGSVLGGNDPSGPVSNSIGNGSVGTSESSPAVSQYDAGSGNIGHGADAGHDRGGDGQDARDDHGGGNSHGDGGPGH